MLGCCDLGVELVLVRQHTVYEVAHGLGKGNGWIRAFGEVIDGKLDLWIA